MPGATYFWSLATKNMNEKQITITGSLLILSLAVMFGLLGKPTEMGIIVAAGAISLAFLNINKIQRFKGAGFEAEMKKAVEDANATVEQLRQVAIISAEAALTSLMADNFMDGTTLKARLNLHDQMITNLRDIGVPEDQIKCADKMWCRGVGIIFHRGVRHRLEGRDEKYRVNPNTPKEVLKASKEFQDLLQFEEWKAPSSVEMREFIEAKSLMTTELSELLDDYKEFERSGEYRRRELFITL